MNQAVATLEQVEAAPRLPALVSGGAVRAIVPQDFEGAWRIASAVCKAGMAPRGLDAPEKAMVAILHGLEVGLTPMNALQSIAVINSRPTLWGDGALGLVQASGKMASHKEWLEGEGDKRKAFCVVVRRGDPEPKTGEFSVSDAKTAGLWKKAGPWTQYSDRMLKMRARAFALRDGFSDVLRGLGIAEEVQDTPIREVVREEPPAPPLAPQIAAAAPEEPPAPDASPVEAAEDTGGIVDFISGKLRAAQSVEELNEVWDKHVTPIERDLFPNDHDDLMSVFRLREGELA